MLYRGILIEFQDGSMVKAIAEFSNVDPGSKVANIRFTDAESLDGILKLFEAAAGNPNLSGSDVCATKL